MKSFTSRSWATIGVIAVAFLVGLGIWLWVHSDAVPREKACIDNLEYIDAAKNEWAQEARVPKSLNPTPTWADLAPYLITDERFWEPEPAEPAARVRFRLPTYPPGATYTIGSLKNSPTCSYSGHTFALWGIRVHVWDASVGRLDGVFEIYERPRREYDREHVRSREHDMRMRPAGSLAGATIEFVDQEGHRFKAITDEDGNAEFSNLGVISRLIVSEDGFFTQSNYIRDTYQQHEYQYNILLKPRQTAPTASSVSAAAPSSEPENEQVSARLYHLYRDARLRLRFTPAYDQAVVNLMIAEANRTARDLGLDETLPITKTDVRAALATPADFIHDLNLGRLETHHYVYSFSAGTTVSGMNANPAVMHNLKKPRDLNKRPIGSLDTNAVLTIANQLMDAAGVDISALNHACTCDIRPAMSGPNNAFFFPNYLIYWCSLVPKDLFDDLPDQSSAMMKREAWSSYGPSGKLTAAWLSFSEPTKINNFRVFDPKYLKNKPLKSLDLVNLLSESNSEETVLYEIKVATNAEARRDLYIKLGAPTSELREVGLEPADSIGATSGFPE